MIVIAKKVGRLANRLVLFSHFIAAAAEHGFVVLNPAFLTYAHYFPATARDLLCRFPSGRAVPAVPGSRRLLYLAAKAAAEMLYRRQQGGNDVGLIRLTRKEKLDLNSSAFLDVVHRHRVVLVQDWFFRNADNCARHRDLVRAHFTPWEHHLAGAHAAVEPARRGDRLVVGVHIRQTDYSRFKGGRFFYSHEQYRRVMDSVEATFSDRDVSFFISSDAPVPRETFAGLDVFYGNGHQLEDLYALAACDRLVGPPSTYSMWASYYGDVPIYSLADPAQLPDADSFYVARGLTLNRTAGQ